MTKLIKFGLVVEDDWNLIDREHAGELPAGKIIVPLSFWKDGRANPGKTVESMGIWIDVDEDVEELGSQASEFALVAVNFPTFMDGRGFSTARLLRERYGYQGEIRAVGNVIRDQLFYMKRCGFDAFQLREGTDLDEALASLRDFDVTYQTSVDRPVPLFRQRSP